MFDLIPWPVLAFLLGAFAVLTLVLYVQRVRERDRLDQLTSWAASRGFTIEPGTRRPADAGFGADLLSLPLFGRGRGQRVRNVMRGRLAEGAVLLFDYRYTTQSGKQSATVEQTVAAFEVAGAPLPAFELCPEGFFQRVGQALGRPDIDFESNPEFSRNYQLRGAAPDAVRRLFERQAVSYLSGTDGWSVEGAGQWLIVFRHHKRQKPDALTAFLDDARLVARTIAGR